MSGDRPQLAKLALAIVLPAILCGVVYAGVEAKRANQEARNAVLQSELQRSAERIRPIRDIERLKQDLILRMRAYEEVRDRGVGVVYVLHWIAANMPDGTHMTWIRRKVAPPDEADVCFEAAASSPGAMDALGALAAAVPAEAGPEADRDSRVYCVHSRDIAASVTAAASS